VWGAPEADAQTAPVAMTRESPTSESTGDGRDVIGRVEMGYRGVFVTNAGYNPYSNDDYFSGFSLTVSHPLFAWSRFVFAPGLSWDYGASSAVSRGDPTSLEVHRLTAPLEGRVRFVAGWGYAFVRLAPGAALEHVELDEGSATPSALKENRWLFATDASVGYAIPLLGVPERRGVFRLWLQSDVGYSWVADRHVDLEPTLPAGGPEAANGLDLGTLGLRGAFFRVAAAMSY
jgi:hypothetical protein